MRRPNNRGARDADCGGRPRILFLIDSLSLTGGAERFALGLATHLPRDRFEVWMCATRRQEDGAVAALEQAGVKQLHLARRSRWDLLQLWGLVQLFRRQRFDVVHAHMFGSNVWGVTFGRAFRVPVVLAHEHNWSYGGDRKRIWIDRNVIARLATRYITVSRSNLEQMVEIERIPREKILVLPTAYIPHRASAQLDLRALLGLPHDASIVATVAVLRVEKALEVLIAALATVIETCSGAHLVVVGDGPCRPDLERRAAQLGLRGRVHFMGMRDDVDAVIRNADVCAMSSDWEGMPLFALEAMAAAKPLVATRVGGMPELVEPGETGMLVPPRDPQALGAALIALLTDSEGRARLGAAAAAKLGDRTIERVTEQFAELYLELLADRPQAPRIADRAAAAKAGPAAVLGPRRASRTGRRRARTDVLVLGYHACSPALTAPLSVTPQALERQIGHLIARGWVPTTFLEAVLDPPSRRTLAITFDDAFASVKRHALPVLSPLGAPATLFVPTAFPDSQRYLSWPGLEGMSSGPADPEFEVLSWEEIRQLTKHGWEIGSHTHSHPRLPLLDDAKLERELVDSRELIETHLGRECLTIAYPYGATDARVAAAAARAGYLAGASLSQSLQNLGPARYPRVGIYHDDGPLRFRLKVSSITRRVRASRLVFSDGQRD